jgi:Beta-lactamase
MDGDTRDSWPAAPRRTLRWLGLALFISCGPPALVYVDVAVGPYTRWYNHRLQGTALRAGLVGAAESEVERVLGRADNVYESRNGRACRSRREPEAADRASMASRFDRLGMKRTTFDFERALSGNRAWPHGQDVDGRTAIVAMDINRSIIPLRPAGGAWSSARDLTRYVQMELDKGKLPDGTALLSEGALLARRAPQVPIGEHATYGMGLLVDTEFGVGGVILTNADGGWLLRAPFVRKVLEELFDGNPEASEDVASSAKTFKAEIAKARERLVVPAGADVAAMLARRYRNEALGDVTVRTRGPATTFSFGEWKSAVASRKNDDGSTSLVTIDPGVNGYEFVVSAAGGKRALVIRDLQHEYVLTEVAEPVAKR